MIISYLYILSIVIHKAIQYKLNPKTESYSTLHGIRANGGSRDLTVFLALSSTITLPESMSKTGNHKTKSKIIEQPVTMNQLLTILQKLTTNRSNQVGGSNQAINLNEKLNHQNYIK